MKTLIIGNWKMYPKNIQEARKIFSSIRASGNTLRNVQTVVCPPFPFIGDLARQVTGHRVVLGAQDAGTSDEGAHTGEVSALQLASLGVTYSIVGHSERRARGETDELINAKLRAVLKAGGSPVLCVGESSRDHDGRYLKHIEAQLKACLLDVAKKDLERLVIAYEPIWAIGKDAMRPASPEDALEVSIMIRRVLADLYGNKASEGVRVLYGGSVDEKNSKSFLAHAQVDGLLVGRASLNANAFSTILSLANEVKRS